MSIVIGSKNISGIQIGGKTVEKVIIGGKTAYELEKVKNPSISCSNNIVTMTCATSGATIRYSTNGGSTYSTYSSPITISSTTTYTAYATKSGMADSVTRSLLEAETVHAAENVWGWDVCTEEESVSVAQIDSHGA